MSKIRKKVSFVVMLSMLLCLLAIPSFAANQYYSFYLGNTGREFQRDTQSSNRKTNINSGWVYNVQSIGFFGCPNLDDTYGMAYSPMTYQSSGTNGAGYYAVGNTSWTKSTGRKTGTYMSGYGGTGLYYLGARLDDELHGYVDAYGVWNSDSW